MLCRVVRVRSRQVDVVIVCVSVPGLGPGGVESAEEGSEGEGEMQVCAEGWYGVIRKEDVRATEKEKVVLGEGFRVGDVVRGVVVGFFFFWSGVLRGICFVYGALRSGCSFWQRLVRVGLSVAFYKLKSANAAIDAVAGEEGRGVKGFWADGSTDLPRRSSELLSLDREERARRYHGEE